MINICAVEMMTMIRRTTYFVFTSFMALFGLIII